MTRQFDPDAIRSQIANLLADREKIDHSIAALESVLRTMEGGERQTELRLGTRSSGETTLQDAVKHVCMDMVDGITRQRVIATIERQYPLIKPLSSSVSAALVNLAKGDHPMLYLATEGRGRSPAVYSTQGTMALQLHADEISELLDDSATKGTGGWQSLWNALLGAFDRSSGTITLTPELRARVYHYYHSYGHGGWQNRVKRVFRRELPHLFQQ